MKIFTPEPQSQFHIYWRNLKIVFSRTTGQISTKLFLWMINHSILRKEIMLFFSLNVRHNYCFVQVYLLIGTVSQVSNVAHGPKQLLLWSDTPFLSLHLHWEFLFQSILTVVSFAGWVDFLSLFVGVCSCRGCESCVWGGSHSGHVPSLLLMVKWSLGISNTKNPPSIHSRKCQIFLWSKWLKVFKIWLGFRTILREKNIG